MPKFFLMITALVLLAATAPAQQNAAPAEQAEAPPATPESFVNGLKTAESPQVQVETTEEGRSIIRVEVEIPYSANPLLEARKLALKYARAFFTQDEFPVDVLELHFTNTYVGKILDLHIGRDRLIVKTRRRERSLIQWDKIETHVQFFRRLKELEKKAETPFKTITYKAYLYPENWPQNELLYGKEKKEQQP